MYIVRLGLIIAMTLALGGRAVGQEEGAYVDELTIKAVSATLSRLNWAPVESVSCKYTITYTVYRGKTADFSPSAKNQIASGITKPTYLAHEASPAQDTYYLVKAVKVPIPPCSTYEPATVLRSGRIFVNPLDLGELYMVHVGDTVDTCTARSTSELSCPTLPDFHAVIASQGSHEFLIGCLSSDYEYGAWTCVNLTLGSYLVSVHSKTLTILDAGFHQVNSKTGKQIAPIIPTFSLLATLK